MEDKLVELFELLCEDFKSLLQKEGAMSSKDRQILIEFLKDNNVSCNGLKNNKINSIIDNLPFSEDVQNNKAINH